MQLTLVPHPSRPPSVPTLKVWARVERSAALGSTATINIWFGVGTPLERFAIPEAAEPGRVDELWRTTCLEAFLKKTGNEAYREWNFAPSGDWAAYDFTAYRQGMAEAPVAAEPYVRIEDNLTWWALGATISVEADAAWEFGLSAVLEEKNGTKSYWTLAHPHDKPDFHDPGCFAAKLA